MAVRTPRAKGKVAVSKAISLAGDTLSGDASVAGVIGAGGTAARVAEMEVYYMLATKHPYVNGCVTLIADAVASEGWSIAPVDGENAKSLNAEEDPRVGDIRKFFNFCYPSTTDRGMRRALIFDIETFGVAYLRRKRAGKLLVGLDRLDPRTVSAKLSADRKSIDSYIIRPRSNTNYATDFTKLEVVPAADILLISMSGGDPLVGLPSPLEALDLTVATDMATRRFREAFFRSGAKAGTILINKSAQREQIDAAERMIRSTKGGAENAYKTWMLSGDWEVQSLAKAGDNDADFVKATGLNREDICTVYKTPVGMLTFSAGALGSSGKSDDRDFFEEFAVLPVEELLYETLTRILHDDFEYYDLRMIPKRRNRVRTSRFASAALGVKFGMTGNEARELVGLSPIVDDRFTMDTPLFIGAPTTGLAEAEPLDAPPVPQTVGQEDGSASASADGAHATHVANEVAQKGGADFRRTRTRPRT